MIRWMKAITPFFLLLIFSIYIPSFASAAGNAADLTSKCSFSVSSAGVDKPKLVDGKHSTAWTAKESNGQYIQITLPKDTPAAGIYIQWNVVPQEWTLSTSVDGNEWSEAALGEKTLFINSYISVSEGAKHIRIAAGKGWKLSVAEVVVFGPGTLPPDVQVWKPQPEKADLMVIPAHPDDEHIYFGGTLPTYAGQLGKHTVVVYMTSSPITRKFEALDGLWKVGVHEYPVFLPLQNKYTSTVDDAELAWDGLDNTVSLLVEQLRRFKPDVVVTHDEGGEYGHGAHKLTALAVEKAVDTAGISDKYKDTSAEFGVWQVKKCYIHLYSENKVQMDWRKPLPAFNGKTALEMAQAGYALHVSQHFRERPILDSGHDDNSKYGLYYSSVGPDIDQDDFFENITSLPVPTPSPSPSPTIAPTVQPTPSDESVPAFAASAKGNTPPDKSIPMRALLILVAVGFFSYILLVYGRYTKKHPIAAAKKITIQRSRAKLIK